MSKLEPEPQYGQDDASFRAAGGQEGIEHLVDAFYDHMERLPEARAIRAMHPQDLTEARRKLSFFLSGWLGGPRRYAEHYGPISIPRVHAHLAVDADARDAWLLCMEKAIAEQPFEPAFAAYLLAALGVPAERVRIICARQDEPPA
ncbi:MAG TPA: group II truncated hemoglobin [Pseudomonadales bacterium]|nr:group II truncated hemoglobin [Pseudomonadales bacterium]